MCNSFRLPFTVRTCVTRDVHPYDDGTHLKDIRMGSMCSLRLFFFFGIENCWGVGRIYMYNYWNMQINRLLSLYKQPSSSHEYRRGKKRQRIFICCCCYFNIPSARGYEFIAVYIGKIVWSIFPTKNFVEGGFFSQFL